MAVEIFTTRQDVVAVVRQVIAADVAFGALRTGFDPGTASDPGDFVDASGPHYFNPGVDTLDDWPLDGSGNPIQQWVLG